MRRPALVPLLAALLVPLAPAVGAAPGDLLAVVGLGHPQLDQPLQALDVSLGFTDANGDSQLQATQPDEPIYLDTNEDTIVSHGDIRLSPFGPHRGGSVVQVEDVDFGRPLASPTGWFATGPGDTWYIDQDATAQVSAGDVRLAGPRPGTKVVGPEDDDFGDQLTLAQPGIPHSQDRAGFLDADRDREYDSGEPLFLDLDAGYNAGARKVSLGDAQIVGRAASAAPQGTVTTTHGGTVDDPASAAAPPAAAQDAWRTLDWVLVALGVLNLAAWAVVARQMRHPRNPFK